MLVFFSALGVLCICCWVAYMAGSHAGHIEGYEEGVIEFSEYDYISKEIK